MTKNHVSVEASIWELLKITTKIRRKVHKCFFRVFQTGNQIHSLNVFKHKSFLLNHFYVIISLKINFFVNTESNTRIWICCSNCM